MSSSMPKFGTYRPVSSLIPLHRYRAFKRGKVDDRADRIPALADQLDLPICALTGSDVHLAPSAVAISLMHQPFDATRTNIISKASSPPIS